MKKILTLMASMAFLLLFVGSAGAFGTYVQTLLPGTSIPKFVDPLPVAGDISVVDATFTGTPAYSIHLREFQAQILPSTGVPLAVPPIPANTPSWVWGYLTDDDVAAQPAIRPSYLGPVVVAERGVPASPTYLNELPDASIGGGFVQNNLLPIDMTLDWANPDGIDCAVDPVTGNYTNPQCGLLPYSGPLPDSVHIHGGEVPAASDGGPDSWFTQTATPGGVITGIGYSGNTLLYPNGQEEATIWFHPHGFGITRLNVFAGMAGVYALVDTGGPSAPLAPMPAFPQYDIPLIIQDRSFDTAGEIFYNLASNPQPNPTVHPFWIPEFIGDAICVNGKTWPYLNVEPRQYRFRLLNGSNARFYDLTLNMVKPTNMNKPNKTKDNMPMPMIAIATDDGYLVNAVSTPNIVIAPGERYEVIVDFTALPVGTQITMKNSARTPFPGGVKVTANGTDTVMQFRVVADSGNPHILPIANGTAIRPGPVEPIINGYTYPTVPIISPPPPGENIFRQLTLNEVIGPGGPLELVVNNSKYNLDVPPDPAVGCTTPLCRETELPQVGDTEMWDIINITADAHPMHTHLTSFQLISRTPFQASQWINQYDAALLGSGVLPGGGPPNQYNVRNADGAIGGNPAIGSFLQLNKQTLPLPYELGWKDTVITYPGEVTRIVVRWAPQDIAVGSETPGISQYPFNPTALVNGVGYVWHCHILDHEDNEMMRTYTVGSSRQPIL